MRDISHIRRRLFGAVVASLFAGSLAFAQGTASVAGTVRDASGGVLPGVTVTAMLKMMSEPAGTNFPAFHPR